MKNGDFHSSTQDIHTISTEIDVFSPFLRPQANGILPEVLRFIY